MHGFVVMSCLMHVEISTNVVISLLNKHQHEKDRLEFLGHTHTHVTTGKVQILIGVEKSHYNQDSSWLRWPNMD